MPFYRRKKSMPKRKRVMRKRRMGRKASRNGVIRIVRKCAEQNIYNTAVAGAAAASGSVVVIGTPYQTPAFAGSSYYNIPFSIETQLDDLLSATELTLIADKYKINWVNVKMYCTSNTASSAGTAQLPSVLWSVDEDDAGIPASTTTGLNLIREKMSSKLRQFKQNGSALSIFYRPKITNTIAGAGGAATAAGVVPAPFIDCNHPSIPHYGVKGYLQDVNLAVTPGVYTQFKFDVTMSVTLRDIQ